MSVISRHQLMFEGPGISPSLQHDSEKLIDCWEGQPETKKCMDELTEQLYKESLNASINQMKKNQVEKLRVIFEFDANTFVFDPTFLNPDGSNNMVPEYSHANGTFKKKEDFSPIFFARWTVANISDDAQNVGKNERNAKSKTEENQDDFLSSIMQGMGHIDIDDEE